MVAIGEGFVGMCEKGKGNKMYKVAVTEQSQGCQVQHAESGHKYCNKYVLWVLDHLRGSVINYMIA